MSIEQTVSPTRFIGRGKPRKTRKDVDIFHCGCCDSYLTGWTCSETGEAPVCCEQPMERVQPIHNDDVPVGARIKYQIRGSLNNNCIVATWGSVRPKWLLLETFRGSQFVYVESGYKEVFALAGMDAYAYCDKDPCKECSFRCKRGFALYADLPGIGIVVRPIDQILTDKG